MQVRFLLGPAGSGKTYRCLTEIQEALCESPEGPPLVLLAPKQATYQFERSLLAHPSVPGFTRLQILSFDRLAEFALESLRASPPDRLDEEGRVMVLRGLLAKKRDDLQVFRASARLTGFARQLSQTLRELQRQELTPQALAQIAGRLDPAGGLSGKLRDLSLLLADYQAWLDERKLSDGDSLLNAAASALGKDSSSLNIGHLWMDGFAELCEQELSLLTALLPCCHKATIAFCLDASSLHGESWLSAWSVVRATFEQCRKRFLAVANADVSIESLTPNPEITRFGRNTLLSRLERGWNEPQSPLPSSESTPSSPAGEDLRNALRIASCPEPETEITLAAREILAFVRAGNRYRDIAVILRTLDRYHKTLQRVFSQYDIPYFLDRRESVAHHPLAELTRGALRTVAFQWAHDDLFAALKTGLAPAEDSEIDRLENEALAHGWKGSVWLAPIVLADDASLTQWLAALLKRLLPPFQKLSLAMGSCQYSPTGCQLADALRDFWNSINARQTLERWAAGELSGPGFRLPVSVHATVWDQMNAWLSNVEMAFPKESLPLREWLPILEAGLAGLSVGVIPPALDQVLVGTLDRSRNPDIKLALVLGMNEGVFPAAPATPVLLTETDRKELAKHQLSLGLTARQQIARERYYGYIACTRARQRLVLTCSKQDADGRPLNPSPFLTQVARIFPSLQIEDVPHALDWSESQHPHELIAPLLRTEQTNPQGFAAAGLATLATLPALAKILESVRLLRAPALDESLSPAQAERLYGPVLRTSVSSMERFAACPFRFFVHSGMRAEERRKFELDSRELGSFQHDVMELFHNTLKQEGKRWRDITPAEAGHRIERIARGLMTTYRGGLIHSSEQNKFTANVLTGALQDAAEALVSWMRSQYTFDPTHGELPYGGDSKSPPWTLCLDNGRSIAINGRIDRVDLCVKPGADEALCVVIDYKSGQKKLDSLLVENGIQLQLLTYLCVLRHWPDPGAVFGVKRLIPVGSFYINLRGKYESGKNRAEALGDPARARQLAYRHTGRFDTRALRQLDSRPDATTGDQFNYRLTRTGEVNKRSTEPLATKDFTLLLDGIEELLREMGRQIYAGNARVAPYRKKNNTACDYCEYKAICRIDPWADVFRVLRKEKEAQPI